MTLTKEELQIVIQCVGQSVVKVQDAPRFIEIINKLSKMVDEVEPKTP